MSMGTNVTQQATGVSESRCPLEASKLFIEQTKNAIEKKLWYIQKR